MGLKLIGGYDFGARSPSAFVIWGQDPKGIWYCIDEIYEPCHNYVEHCAKIKANPYVASKMVTQIICDSQMAAETQMRIGGKSSMIDLFAEQGVIMSPGRKGADLTLVQLLRFWWRDMDKPEAFICENCWNTKREIMGLKWHPQTGANARVRNAPDKIMDRNNHAFDASAYPLDTRPKPPAFLLNERGQGRTWNDVDQRMKDAERERNYADYRV
jgi:hypothetical protein